MYREVLLMWLLSICHTMAGCGHAIEWGGVLEAFANHSFFLPTTQRCDSLRVHAGATRPFPGVGTGSGCAQSDLRSAARAKVWEGGFAAIGAEGCKGRPAPVANKVFD